MDTVQVVKGDSKIPLIDWLTCTPELKNLGFTIEEINTALKQSKVTVYSLTDEEDYQSAPSYMNTYECISEPFGKDLEEEINTKYNGYTNDYTTCTRHYRATVQTYRIAGHYQSTHHADIIRHLLNNKLKWFKSFKWSMYAMSGEGKNYEIYMETSAGSLYVKVQALLKPNWQTIEDRMLSYFGESRNLRDAKVKRHNHKKNEHQQTNGGCPLCQERFYQKEIGPLYSEDAKRLKKILS